MFKKMFIIGILGILICGVNIMDGRTAEGANCRPICWAMKIVDNAGKPTLSVAIAHSDCQYCPKRWGFQVFVSKDGGNTWPLRREPNNIYENDSDSKWIIIDELIKESDSEFKKIKSGDLIAFRPHMLDNDTSCGGNRTVIDEPWLVCKASEIWGKWKQGCK